MSYADGYIKWLRSHVGHQLIYLVYTLAFVYDEQDRLLVQERYDFDWLSVPGGALELDETLHACVLREVREETGVTCAVERLVGVFSHPKNNLLYPNGDQVQPWTVAFVCRATNDAIQVDGKETLQAAFRPVDEIRHRLPEMYQEMLAFAEQGTTALESVYFGPNVRPYYPILRQHVGHDLITLPGATAVIYNDSGDVLVVHEMASDIWDFPSGFADLDESSTATAVREVREETGFQVEPVRVIGLYGHPTVNYSHWPNGDEARFVDLILECKIIGGNANPDGSEIDGIKFMSLANFAAQPKLSQSRRVLLQDLMSGQPGPFVR